MIRIIATRGETSTIEIDNETLDWLVRREARASLRKAQARKAIAARWDRYRSAHTPSISSRQDATEENGGSHTRSIPKRQDAAKRDGGSHTPSIPERLDAAEAEKDQLARYELIDGLIEGLISGADPQPKEFCDVCKQAGWIGPWAPIKSLWRSEGRLTSDQKTALATALERTRGESTRPNGTYLYKTFKTQLGLLHASDKAQRKAAELPQAPVTTKPKKEDPPQGSSKSSVTLAKEEENEARKKREKQEREEASTEESAREAQAAIAAARAKLFGAGMEGADGFS